jgi:hypothetical protein
MDKESPRDLLNDVLELEIKDLKKENKELKDFIKHMKSFECWDMETSNKFDSILGD